MARKSPLRPFDFMGTCESSVAEARARNAEINRAIERDRRINEATIKLLLLGASESGKSTILKQLKIIHDNGYSEKEALNKRELVYVNVVQAMNFVLEGRRKLRVPFEHPSSEEHAQLVAAVIGKHKENEKINDHLYTALHALKNDAGVTKTIERRNEFYLPDSALHFIASLERICSETYVPTQEDILLLRISTMGVIEVKFQIKDRIWRVFDVGGQRSQRKKWIACFDDVRAVIFVVALSEYDQVLMEDSCTNRMHESLQLFKQVCNNKYFTETSMVLFLNKRDLFQEKISKANPLRRTFPEYQGPENYESTTRYIERKFFLSNLTPNKNIYCHLTHATDTKQVTFVLDSVLDAVLSSKLKGCGLY